MIKSFYERLLTVFQTSSHVAYTYYGENHTYTELYHHMRKINYYLPEQKQKKIVLYGSKSFPMYSAIYSIILSGNIWVPMTPGLPADRLSGMLDVLTPDVVLYETDLPETIRAYGQSRDIELWRIEDILNHDNEKDFLDLDFAPNDWAYIMFTSGSTGVPKGVPMTHQNYINFVENALEILPFSKGEVFSDYHDFAFDISIFYLFCAPLTESALAPIQRKEERMFPLNHMQKNKITVWSSVPSIISCLQRFRPQERQEISLKIMFLCGEPMSLDVLRYCYTCLDVEHVYNFYGLTETGVENFYHTCTIEDLTRYTDKGFVPIGLPLKGNNIKITEEKELLLSGCQIMPGYLGDVGHDCFEEVDGVRWYHTGDIVDQYQGVYFCKGRLDAQVKISGYRVELMDIEVHVRQFSGVKEAVCCVDQVNSTQRLVCAIELAKGSEIDFSKVSRKLKDKLPDYMIPKKFFVLNEMPTNKNGKIDRKAIQKIYLEKFNNKAPLAIQT